MSIMDKPTEEELLDELAAGELTLLAVAVHFPIEFTTGEGAYVNFLGFQPLIHCLARGLDLAGVEHHQLEGVQCGQGLALTRGATWFIVRDVQAAVPVLLRDLKFFALMPYAVIGAYDFRELYWRTIHPAEPAFDLHQFLVELTDGAEKDLQACRAAFARLSQTWLEQNPPPTAAKGETPPG